MLTPDPASLLSHQTAIFGNIERVLNNPIPDFCSGLPKLDRAGTREWLTGPFLTIARQFVVPPPSDDPSEDPAPRSAALLLRLAHKVVCRERVTQVDELNEPSEELDSLTSPLEWEIQRHQLASPLDRGELNRALQKGPVAPSPHPR
ncbi:unnamed protein product [Gemmata massiliana]|uniref:Uncharacterized protein n=1 Tax=Gemmata massiliana TaxID=1210884 RepID=A0A6P2D212_9BACT|nr:hypothetical protein [Gemmata massiliana]VTR95143.1 unnamed protein product [Gemmata massiliana]